jgi:putative transposase
MAPSLDAVGYVQGNVPSVPASRPRIWSVFCYPYVMPRIARITLANMPHHVTQRGNAGQFLLAADSEKNVYLALLQKYLRLYSVALAGYCLMSNHVHLILVPGEPDALAVALKQIHGRFASFWNATHCSSGHVWQGRFYSCPLDDAHLWIALKYVERNPVRAQLVHRPEQWKWSSAAVHCGTQIAPSWLAMNRFSQRWTVQTWTDYAAEIESDAHLRAIRKGTHTGRPLGPEEFVREIEMTTNRNLLPQKRAVPGMAASPMSNRDCPSSNRRESSETSRLSVLSKRGLMRPLFRLRISLPVL